MKIYCCGCEKHVKARITCGKEIYPHRADLHDLKFWKCDICKNHVGCHANSNNKPLGCIATPEIKKERMRIHKIIDPLWKNGLLSRKTLYAMISEKTGVCYHTANIKSIEQAVFIQEIAKEIAKSIRERAA